MKKYFEALKSCTLFREIDEAEITAMLECLGATIKAYGKGTYIWTAESKALQVGIVLSGSVNIIKEDYWGNRTILAKAEKGEMFGEAFSCANVERLPIGVVAAENTEIMLIDCKRIITTCSSACLFHTMLIRNMMKILAEKNIMMTQKMDHMARRTTREKLLSYLSSQAIKARSNSFNIPFDRQELADYLSVDRSAMSNELSKMRDEGILSYKKNYFVLEKDDLDLH